MPVKDWLRGDITKDDIQDFLVDEGDGTTSIWGEISGTLYERFKNANIKGCHSGNFKCIDWLDENYVFKGKKFKAGISLKAMNTGKNYATTTRFEDAVAKYLSDFMNFNGDTKNLYDPAQKGKKSVSVTLNDFDVFVLMIGIPQTDYNKYKTYYRETEKAFSDSSLGGNGLQRRTISGGFVSKTIPAQVVIEGIPENMFQENPGDVYEFIKGADILGKPPGTFMTIDKFVKDKKRVISYKAHDLRKSSFQDTAGLAYLRKTVRAEIDELIAFHKYTEPGTPFRSIVAKDYEEKRLSIAIPKIDLSQSQENIFESLYDYAKDRGVQLRVHKTV